MIVKTVKVSSKGQITLPKETLRALDAGRGTEFVLIQEGDRLVLVKAADAGQRLVDDLGGWSNLGIPAFEDLWGNEADEVWDEA